MGNPPEVNGLIKKQLANFYLETLCSRIDAKGDVLAIESKQIIEMKEGNSIAPYRFRRVSLILKLSHPLCSS